MKKVDGADVLKLTEDMGYFAHGSVLGPEARVATVDLIANWAQGHLGDLDTQTDAGDYLRSYHVKSWLACVPSLLTSAADKPHDMTVSQEALDNLLIPLQSLLEDTSDMDHGLGGDSAHGLLGEMAVLGTLLWSHATIPERAKFSVVPATIVQDRSASKHSLSGFDLILDSVQYVTPLEVKSSDQNDRRRQKYGERNLYQTHIAKIYISRLLGLENGSDEHFYAPQLLADSVIRRDEATLDFAINAIDASIRLAQQRYTSMAELYQY